MDIGTTENLFVNALGGIDTVTGGVGLDGLIVTSVDGGDGNDTLTGGDGADHPQRRHRQRHAQRRRRQRHADRRAAASSRTSAAPATTR